MTYFEILQSKMGGSAEWKIGNFTYNYHRHSTGQSVNVYLEHMGRKILVFYKTDWFSSAYDFNEKDKIQGFQAPNKSFNLVVEKQFLRWEEEIEAKKALEIEKKKQEELAAKQKLIDDINFFDDMYKKMAT